MLVEHNISGVPVVGGTGALVGVLTEQDCLRVFATGAYSGERSDGSLTVSAVMSDPEHTVSPDLDLFGVAQQFLRHHVRRLPVVADGALVSRRDVLRGIQQLVDPEEPADRREPKLYPSATETSPAVLANRLR